VGRKVPDDDQNIVSRQRTVVQELCIGMWCRYMLASSLISQSPLLTRLSIIKLGLKPLSLQSLGDLSHLERLELRLSWLSIERVVDILNRNINLKYFELRVGYLCHGTHASLRQQTVLRELHDIFSQSPQLSRLTADPRTGFGGVLGFISDSLEYLSISICKFCPDIPCKNLKSLHLDLIHDIPMEQLSTPASHQLSYIKSSVLDIEVLFSTAANIIDYYGIGPHMECMAVKSDLPVVGRDILEIYRSATHLKTLVLYFDIVKRFLKGPCLQKEDMEVILNGCDSLQTVASPDVTHEAIELIRSEGITHHYSVDPCPVCLCIA
jgi:hypothetical protein